MRPFVPLTALLLLALAVPASGQDEVDDTSAEFGFPIAIGILIVVSIVFALVWRHVSKKKQRQ